MHVLVTSPRVAPGLMTSTAWDVLRAADRVVGVDDGDPTVVAVRAAGIDVVVNSSASTPDALTPDAQPARRGASDSRVVWLAPVGDVAWSREVAARLVEGDAPVEVEVVFGSYDLPGARLLDLVAVMDRLRRECPWTNEQTHASLSPYLLEETYEVLDALDRADTDDLREELGDLLMQVVFHAAVAAEEQDGWDIDDVAESIVEKLVHRNPHVFGDVVVAGAGDVEANWQALKATEKRRSSVLEGIPATLPALAYADKVLGRLERDGRGSIDVDADELGERMLALVRDARAGGIDAEAALRVAVRRLVGPR